MYGTQFFGNEKKAVNSLNQYDKIFIDVFFFGIYLTLIEHFIAIVNASIKIFACFMGLVGSVTFMLYIHTEHSQMRIPIVIIDMNYYIEFECERTRFYLVCVFVVYAYE